MSLRSPQNRFSQGMGTVTPGRLVVMLCERLVRDVDSAVAALASNDIATFSTSLVHAQEIVGELESALAPGSFKGSDELASVYRYLLERLIAANLKRDRAALAESRRLASEVHDLWLAAWKTTNAALPTQAAQSPQSAQHGAELVSHGSVDLAG